MRIRISKRLHRVCQVAVAVCFVLAPLLMLILPLASARAASANWNISPGTTPPGCPKGGAWGNPDCWISGLTPKRGDEAAIFHVGGPVTLDTTLNLSAFSISGGSFETNGYSIRVQGGVLPLGEESIGGAGWATTFDQTGGTNTTDGLGIVVGTYNLRSGTISAGGLAIATAAGGVEADFNQRAGTKVNLTGVSLLGVGVTAGTLNVAQGASSKGTYLMQGGTLSANVEGIGVGSGSNGSFLQTGGVNTMSSLGLVGKLGSLFIATAPAATAEYTLTGSQSQLKADRELVGVAGVGTLRQEDGVNISAAQIVGLNGIGTVIQSGGSNSTSVLSVGQGPGSASASGTYNLSQNARLNADSETIGTAGRLGTAGTFNQFGGINTVKGTLLINQTGPAGPLKALSRYTLQGGVLDASTVDNFGVFNYTGGLLHGNVTNENGAVFSTAGGSSLVVSGSFRNMPGGEMDISGRTTVGPFYEAGEVKFDPATAEVSQMTVAASGYVVAGAGSELRVDGDFINQSTQKTLWDTSQATLDFSGAGRHRFVLNGTAGGGAANNYAWGTLSLGRGSILDLVAGVGNALYVATLQGVDVFGGSVTNIEGSPGLIIYYDTADNPGLHGEYRLMGGGELIALAGGTSGVPEPGTLGLLALGLALSLIVAPRPRRPRLGDEG
jgi:hypothetical protein